jgi:hypothetical protein
MLLDSTSHLAPNESDTLTKTNAELTSSAKEPGNDFVETLDPAWLHARALELTRKAEPRWKQR